MQTTKLFNKSMKNVGKTLFYGYSTVSGIIEKKVSRNKEIKVRYFLVAKVKDIYHYGISLIEKENIILRPCTNDASYKSGTNILKELIDLKDLIMGNLPNINQTLCIF